jgi:hypothetical protein
MMIIALIIVLVCIPLVFINSGNFQKVLTNAGVKIHPNFNDGSMIAEFNDPPDDLLLSLPPDTIFKGAEKSLDLRKFSVKKVKFSSLSGMGIDPRLNLCFEFIGKQPNQLNSIKDFSFPVIHVYIKPPGDSSYSIHSDKTAKINFDNDGWKYQVIIDGMHEQAMIYDYNGVFITKGKGLYINYSTEKDTSNRKNKKIISTNITAALPLDLIGDPEKGEWKYYVALGLLDIRRPSLFYPCINDTSTDVFDCILPADKQEINIDVNGKLRLYPLIIKN